MGMILSHLEVVCLSSMLVLFHTRGEELLDLG